MNYETEVAKALLAIEAVTLRPHSPYVWASGIKSPIYCDNRLTISYPKIRKLITQGLIKLIEEKFPETEAIVGTATAGIPQACWIADQMELPLAYVRAGNKDHGKGNAIEGKLAAGTKVVVIEDLISTGGSSIQACERLREAGIEVLGICAIFNYQMRAAMENFAQHQLAFYTLSNYQVLIDEALKAGYIAKEDLELLNTWSQNPQDYAKAFA